MSVHDRITALQEMRTDEYFMKIFKSVEQQQGAAVENRNATN